MNEAPNPDFLLCDAMEQTIVNPTDSQRWHALVARYEQSRDPGARDHVRRELTHRVPADGIEGFLRATFLAFVGGDPAHTAEAARIVQKIAPIDVERLMAFAAFEWGRALGHTGGRARFAGALRNARLPEVVSLAGSQLRATAPVRPAARPIGPPRKAAMIVPFLGPPGHSPTELAFRNARIARETGLETRIFCCQDLSMPHMPNYLGSMGRVSNAIPDRETLIAMVPPGMAITLADERFSLLARWHDMLRAVTDFDPDLIFFAGFYAPLAHALYETRPVLALSIHSVSPMVPADVWLTADRERSGLCETDWAPALPPAWGHYHPFRILLRPEGPPVTRADLGVEDGDTLAITVGTRLDTEIAGPWALRITALLKDRPKLVWVLAGGNGVRPEALRGVPDRQLRIVPFTSNIRALTRRCDIFLNPERLGGGFSVAEAMAEGLPVLALANSDGGIKLGAHAVETLDEYFARLNTLLDSPAERHRMGVALRSLFAATLDLDRSGPSLLTACELTVERYNARSGARDQASAA